LDALSNMHAASCKEYQRLLINPWRGRVAVLFESGVPRLPQKRRSARNSSAIVRSENPPRRKAEVPRVEKNRPFHAGSITALCRKNDALSRQRSAAGPTEVECGRVFLVALGAGNRGTAAARAKELVDHRKRAGCVVGLLDPELREREVDRKLAREARGIRVEDPGANAPGCEQICEEVRLRQVGCGVDAFQNR
jgi:hypothetical protein